MKMIALAAVAASLLGCAGYPASTTASRPEAFKTVQEAKYRPADQLRFMDCLYDGLLASQGYGVPTDIRQIKRADGYRLDVVGMVVQYIVIYIKDDGTYKLDVWTDPAQIYIGKELAASAACVKKFEVAA